ncbi:MAG: hypothetical protein M3Y41_20635 [Pseudomonadota bacterium]|nr:hypothetical protein [Pseudomonadota bacterium]
MSRARFEVPAADVEAAALEPSVSPSLSAGRAGVVACAGVAAWAIVVEMDEIALMGLLLLAVIVCGGVLPN